MHMYNENFRKIYFSLNICPKEYMNYYKGSAKNVVVTSAEGLRVKFPAGALQKYVTAEGIQGDFVIRFNSENKLIGIEKL